MLIEVWIQVCRGGCAVLFILLAVLWLFREPRFIPGWASIFPSKDGKRYILLLTLYSLLHGY